MRRDEFPIVDKHVKNEVNAVLDKIRAEIEEPLKINEGMHTDSAKAQAIALSWCIEIIDKYIGTDEITEHYKKLGEYYNKGENE